MPQKKRERKYMGIHGLRLPWLMIDTTAMICRQLRTFELLANVRQLLVDALLLFLMRAAFSKNITR